MCEICRMNMATEICDGCGREVCEHCCEEYDNGIFCDLCDPDEYMTEEEEMIWWTRFDANSVEE